MQFHAQKQDGPNEVVTISTLVTALKECCHARNLGKGKALHGYANETGLISNIYVSSCLVNMYAKCGSMVDAHKVFDKMFSNNVVAWTALIFGYVENGEEERALKLFAGMQKEGCPPNARTFLAAVKACIKMAVSKGNKVGVLEKGRAIHAQVFKCACCTDTLLMTALVEMYVKCGCLLDAQQVFDTMEFHDVIAWSTLILGYAENGEGKLALQVFGLMKRKGCVPNTVTFLAVIKAVGTIRCLSKAQAVHFLVCTVGYDTEVVIGNSLIDMYGKCGSIADFCMIFAKMLQHDFVSWNTLIMSYLENGEVEMALESFATMSMHGTDCRTFSIVIKALTISAEIEEGMKVGRKVVKLTSLNKARALHAETVRSGYDKDMVVSTNLLSLYGKCGSMADACSVFDKMNKRDIVSWTALMLGYADNEEEEVSLCIYNMLISNSCRMDHASFLAALKACINLAIREEGKLVKLRSLEKGMAIHLQILNCHLEINVLLTTSLVDMYRKCGCMLDAQKVFDQSQQHDVVCWTALILGYQENGEEERALDLIDRMQCERCAPNAITYVAVAKACASMSMKEQCITNHVKFKSLERGLTVHWLASQSGFMRGKVANTLVDMYAKCGNMLDAQRVFDGIHIPDAVSWNALIHGYSLNGDEKQVLNLFAEMTHEGLTPSAWALVAVLKGCSSLSALQIGKAVYGHVLCNQELKSDPFLAASLVDCFCKCGSIEDAQQVFDEVSPKSLTAWNSLMAGYGRHGNCQQVLNLFHKLRDEGLTPDRITFLAVLTACSHAGLVNVAKNCFEDMVSKYGIQPDIELYTSMVSILAQTSHEDALAMLKEMPRNILSAWEKKQKNSRLGRVTFDLLTEREKDVANYMPECLINFDLVKETVNSFK